MLGKLQLKWMSVSYQGATWLLTSRGQETTAGLYSQPPLFSVQGSNRPGPDHPGSFVFSFLGASSRTDERISPRQLCSLVANKSQAKGPLGRQRPHKLFPFYFSFSGYRARWIQLKVTRSAPPRMLCRWLEEKSRTAFPNGAIHSPTAEGVLE